MGNCCCIETKTQQDFDDGDNIFYRDFITEDGFMDGVWINPKTGKDTLGRYYSAAHDSKN